MRRRCARPAACSPVASRRARGGLRSAVTGSLFAHILCAAPMKLGPHGGHRSSSPDPRITSATICCEDQAVSISRIPNFGSRTY